ncbi:efflux transporter outer membrane subunit [Piscinibacter sp.]|uniref:efflux transporter outer membrane subunit n=1 Tax=Piscinibacter sp. TaxID=1903157 RepID=UPI0039E59F8B
MPRHPLSPRRAPLALAALALAACASIDPAPAPATAAAPAAQWQAALPAGADPAVALRDWWQQFDDPLLTQLIDAAQAASPTLADARARIEQASAARTGAGAALGPTLNAGANATRGRLDLATPVGTSLGASLQAGWEIDLFGANRASRDAAQARLEGSQAQWHDARISVAAETGSAYLALRACEAQLAQRELDAASRAETARLTELAAKAGFEAPASAELARASAAQGNATLTQQRASCELAVKALVALTALPEASLREQLAARRASLPRPAQLGVAAVPAQALAQRPDVAAAERELAAAAADTAQARAQRYPRVTLAGSIGPSRFESGGASASGTLWSIGPVSVSLPLFDGGVRRANVRAAQAAYDAAATRYAARLRGAVREVEEALVALASTAARGEDARNAAEGYERSLRAVEARYRGGLASLFELEDARRSAVAAQSALIELQRERVAAWISLYRSLGGGWSADALAAAADTPRR